jgi:DNA repair exonuclease SbcCD ATPase subunit
MSETAETMAAAFEAEAGQAPVVNVSDVDASTVATNPTNTTSKFYTEDDLTKVRSQEKEKLYPQIESLKEELSSLKKEREEESARKAENDKLEAERLKSLEESELDVRDLLKKKEQEWQEQLERERQERERAFALLEREKSYADLQAYRQQVVEQERENIIPELVDLISGNTREEIAESVDGLKSRSAKILESVQSATQNARREMKGTSITTPPAGPLETNSEQRPLTPQEIAAMSMNDYAKYRDRIMSDSARGKSRGLFG